MRQRENPDPFSPREAPSVTDGGARAALTPLAREALDLVVHLGSGTATVRDAETAAGWRAQGADHEAAFRDAVRARRGVQAMLEAHAANNVVAYRARTVSRRKVVLATSAIAASAAGAVLLAEPPLGLWPSYSELMADYRTGPGERRAVVVAGVNIDMNTRTSIGRRDQGIDLIAGEAFVTVARDAPFLAIAGSGMIAATQAAFNLRHIDGAACVTCVAGRLRVTQGNARADLSSGHQLTYGPAGFGRAQPASDAVATAWRSGLLIFKGEPLAHVVAELNRYRAGRIMLTDSALAQHPVSAVFHLDQMANAVTQIEQLLGVRGTHLPGGVVLIG